MNAILRIKDENIVTKGEIARFEKFLLLPECFQRSSAAEASENVYMRERVKELFCFKYEQKVTDFFFFSRIMPVYS